MVRRLTKKVAMRMTGKREYTYHEHGLPSRFHSVPFTRFLQVRPVMIYDEIDHHSEHCSTGPADRIILSFSLGLTWRRDSSAADGGCKANGLFWAFDSR